jgi:hypothetical protein
MWRNTASKRGPIPTLKVASGLRSIVKNYAIDEWIARGRALIIENHQYGEPLEWSDIQGMVFGDIEANVIAFRAVLEKVQKDHPNDMKDIDDLYAFLIRTIDYIKTIVAPGVKGKPKAKAKPKKKK